jgi:hypothetical protein
MDIYINSSSAPISSTDLRNGWEELGEWGRGGEGKRQRGRGGGGGGEEGEKVDVRGEELLSFV